METTPARGTDDVTGNERQSRRQGEKELKREREQKEEEEIGEEKEEESACQAEKEEEPCYRSNGPRATDGRSRVAAPCRPLWQPAGSSRDLAVACDRSGPPFPRSRPDKYAPKVRTA